MNMRCRVYSLYTTRVTWLHLQGKLHQCCARPSDMVTPATQMSKESLLFLHNKKTCTVRARNHIPTGLHHSVMPVQVGESANAATVGVPSVPKRKFSRRKQNKTQITTATNRRPGRQSKTHISSETTERTGRLFRHGFFRIVFSHFPDACDMASLPTHRTESENTCTLALYDAQSLVHVSSEIPFPVTVKGYFK